MILFCLYAFSTLCTDAAGQIKYSQLSDTDLKRVVFILDLLSEFMFVLNHQEECSRFQLHETETSLYSVLILDTSRRSIPEIVTVPLGSCQHVRDVLCVKPWRAILKSLLWVTRSQFNDLRTGLLWMFFLVLVRTQTAAFWMNCSSLKIHWSLTITWLTFQKMLNYMIFLGNVAFFFLFEMHCVLPPDWL